MSRPQWLDASEQEAWRSYHRMRTQLAATLSQLMVTDSGISEPDFEILVVLSEAPEGTLQSKDLRYELQWEKSRLAHMLRRMEGRGYISRCGSDHDGRASLVSITDAGWDVVRTAAPANAARVREFFLDPLTPEQLEALTVASQAILANLDAKRPTA